MSIPWARVGRFLPVLTLVLLAAWLVETPPGLLGKADAIGYSVCHRIDTHSFFLSDRQLPLCARCTGMYLGALVGLGYAFFKGRLVNFPPLRIQIVLGIFLLAFAVDGVNSYLNLFRDAPALYASQNWLRLLTGTFLGIGAGVFLAAAFQQTVWNESDPRPALENFRQLGGLILVGAGIELAILSDNPLIQYPLAVLSALTVPLILTLAYSVLWVLIFKRDNLFTSWRSLWLPLTGGFTTALVQVFAIDIVRLALTGTWQGFKF
ncbi:MAG TPA: DUF2085 domain-containing protein [Anaerolineaceae bacterium]|nr:DUF2085 domain-containing protein [Anaerolineaceae bacterium]